MLAYRHSFHAGNHADVLKHIVQIAVLNYFNEKDKPYWVIDTHAGAGMYSLVSKHAQLKSEFEKGIRKLYDRDDLPPLIAQYVDLVKSVNKTVESRSAQGIETRTSLAFYPGSPCLSAALLPPGDKLRLFELHPTDFTLLREHFAGHRAVSMKQDDGLAGLKASLPPPPRRAVVLIDPSYELKEDYQLVYSALKDSLTRFAQGTYIIWYPVLNRPEWRRMAERLERLEVKWVHVNLTVAQPDEEGFGMLGSGLFVVNPPFVLEEQLRVVMPYLVKHLGQYTGANFYLQSYVPKGG